TKTRNIFSNNKDHLFIWTRSNSVLYFSTSTHAWGTKNLNCGDLLGIACSNDFIYGADRDAIRKFRIADGKQVAAYSFKGLTDHVIGACTVYPIGDQRVMAGFDGQVVEFDTDLQH